MTDQTELTSDAEFIEAIAAFGDLMRAFILNEPQTAPEVINIALEDTRNAKRAAETAIDLVETVTNRLLRVMLRVESDVARCAIRRLSEITANLVWTAGEIDSIETAIIQM